jgi:hypothetical protein
MKAADYAVMLAKQSGAEVFGLNVIVRSLAMHIMQVPLVL